MMMEGPDLSPDQLAELCAALFRSFQAAADPDCGVNFIYHANDNSHVGVDGILLARRCQ